MLEHRGHIGGIDRTLIEVLRPPQPDPGRDRSGLDDADPHAEGAELLTGGRGETGQRRLRRRIGAAVGQREARQHRSDHDDAAVSSPAHAGKDELAQTHGSEDIGLEQAVDGGARQLLERTRLALAGIVDEHIDRADLLAELLCQCVRPIRVGQIESQIADTGHALLRGKTLGVTAGRDHRAALGRQGLDNGPADARGAAGDEGGEIGLCHLRSPFVSTPRTRGSDRPADRRRCTRPGTFPPARCSRACRLRRSR